MKWSELGGKVIYINPRGTSSYAFDGSGKVKRNKQNYALAQFSNSKYYNADLSAMYNVGARGILKLCGGNNPSQKAGQNWTGLDKSPQYFDPILVHMCWIGGICPSQGYVFKIWVSAPIVDRVKSPIIPFGSQSAAITETLIFS